jgi:hypothetical protein
MMAGRVAGLVLAAALAASGCGSTRVPETVAARDQTTTQHRLDVADCKAEVGYRNNYNADVSPTGNILRNLFTLGIAGASVGGLVTGLPATTVSDASEGLIAGAGAGGIAGGAVSIHGRSRFEREWIACMESRGYTVVATPKAIH